MPDVRITIAKIEEELQRLTPQDPELASRFQQFTDTLVGSPALTSSQKQAVAQLLLELVHDQAQPPHERRTAVARSHLMYGLRRTVAPHHDLAGLWADIEPNLTA